MRLTLRTLLAYKSGIMKPDDYREIEAQLKASAGASKVSNHIDQLLADPKDVFERTSAVNPNVVSAYIGNHLHAQAVVEYEKLCLGDDAELLEVSACNEILARFYSELPPDVKKLRPKVRTSVLAVLPTKRPQ